MRSDYIDPVIMGHILAALTPANAAAIEVAMHTGLRIDDVLSMETKKLGQRMWVKEKKTGKTKRIYLSAPLLARLKALAGPVFVFQGRLSRNKHRTRQAVYKDIVRAREAFRLKEHVSPHSARKIYAVEAFQKSGDLKKVQKLLNHSDPAVTAIYAMADQLTARRSRRCR